MSIWKPTWNFVPITFYETIGNLENMTQCTRIKNNIRGKTLRIKFTNRGNSAPLILDHVTLSVRNRVTNQITRHAEVSHNGQKNIFLAPEEEFDSDEIPLSVSEEDDLEVCIYFSC